MNEVIYWTLPDIINSSFFLYSICAVVTQNNYFVYKIVEFLVWRFKNTFLIQRFHIKCSSNNLSFFFLIQNSFDFFQLPFTEPKSNLINVISIWWIILKCQFRSWHSIDHFPQWKIDRNEWKHWHGYAFYHEICKQN